MSRGNVTRPMRLSGPRWTRAPQVTTHEEEIEACEQDRENPSGSKLNPIGRVPTRDVFDCGGFEAYAHVPMLTFVST